MFIQREPFNITLAGKKKHITKQKIFEVVCT